MQSFVVSARKYRPASWHDVIGQDQVVTTLKNAIRTDHLAQSFLFCGPRGVGKTTCARILAKTINCENITKEGEACNECESCKSFNENASFNIHEIDAASNNSVEDIRSLVDQVRYAPASGKFKIYIIDEVHMLSPQAFNAFLKTLEEPPTYVKFILATTEKHKIIPTILSRCQIFDFNRIRIRDMVKQLEIICKSEGITCTEEALHLVAQRADGAMRDALSIFDRITSFSGKSIEAKDVIDNLNILDYEYFFRITECAVSEDATTALVLFDEIINKGFDGDVFINGLAEHFRNLLMCKEEKTIGLLDTSEAAIEKYTSQSQMIPASFLLSGLNLLNSADIQYRGAKNKRLHVELVIMKLCYIHNAVSALASGSVEKKTPDLNKTVQLKPKIEPQREAEPLPVNPSFRPEPKSEVPPVQKVVVQNNAINPPVPEQIETVMIPKKTDLRQSVRKEEEQRKLEVPVVQVTQEKILIEPEDFFVAWKQFAAFIRTEKQAEAIIMDHAAVSIDDRNIVTVKLDSSYEVNILKGVHNELHDFIKQSLQNNTFEINFVVEAAKQEKVKRPYTAQEKYKKMEELNPLIRDLKEKLGFELDY
ncbi:MAG TPA: DNA polymerase III subunit gamma/tau [Chitinophagales bacterium]|nr:DNA polymerase III subunit gamma/tau [Chitinophagales bacterium]